MAIEDAMLAIGWLARENSIFIEKRENTIYLSNGSEYHFCFG
ncbi:winged helix-turn-helix domain-containing protein [Bacteroides salyersiae]|nr:winged helix-turn-helix domain-containing protein [Bacteroides salyersiae]